MSACRATLLSVTIGLSASLASAMPQIEIVETFNIDGMGNHAIDVFYTPSEGLDSNHWELLVIPTVGGLLDPDPGKRSDNVTDGAAIDSWANTVFSSLGAGAASHIFTSYNPGSAFPPVAADPLPTAGGDPDRLEWIIFDTISACDGDCSFEDFIPFHMGRVMYGAGGRGTVEAKFYENGINPDIPHIKTATYGIPEPSSLALGGGILVALISWRRRFACSNS